ncbi:unknown [Bacteroides sp. CAG:144]|nr:unknown [Bacteroides sp. CAG:144]
MFLSGSGGCGKRKYILWIIFFENYENKPIFVVYLSLRAYTKKMKSCGRFFLFL